MKVMQVHNRYRVRGGEDISVQTTVSLLRRGNVEVCEFIRDSGEIRPRLLDQLRAFCSGIYSRSAHAAMSAAIRHEQPDVVHVHNLYPLLSPSVLLACKEAGVPVVMTCHNFRLLCPVGTFVSHGQLCLRCEPGREHWCVLRNCPEDPLKAVGYALRSYVARRLALVKNNVTLFVTPTAFVRDRLVRGGFADRHFAIVPHAVPVPTPTPVSSNGRYALYVGRVSPEKGVRVLVDAACKCPEIPVRIIGDYSAMPRLPAAAPANVEFVGPVPNDRMMEYYSQARFLIVPSICLETFGLVAAEAMSFGLPVIASRIGGLPEVVDDGVTGLFVAPGEADDLAEKMESLWQCPDLRERMGKAAQKKSRREYGEGTVFNRLMAAYETAISLKQE